MRTHSMRKILAALAIASVALVAGAFAQTPQPANNVLGDVIAVDAASKQIFVKTDAGAVVIVTVSDATKILKNPPGETKLDKATPMGLAEIAAGDRVFARGRPSADGKSLVNPGFVVVNTRADLAAKQEAERAEWRRRGLVGVVTALNPETKEITVQTRTAEGPKPIVIPTSGANVKLTRYAPDSIKFSERKPATFEEVKVGDQLRAKGDRSEDGARFNAEEIVTGTSRIAVGAITAVDESKNEFTIKQLQGDQPLTVVVRPDTVLKQIPPEALAMMGGMGGPGAGGAGSGAGGGQRQGGQGQGSGQGQGAGAGQGSGQAGGAGAGQGGGQGAGQGGGQGQ